MKKIKYLSFIICLALIPMFSVNAVEKVEDNKTEELEKFKVVAGDTVTSSGQVNGSSIVAGSNVNAENTVNGLDMVFGQTVTYNGNSDYSIIAGESVNVNGITNNDGFIFGNSITFNENYIASRDLFVFASSVILRGEIKRDVIIFASTVVLENVNINGNITIYASTVDVKNANISGTLFYEKDTTITISDDSVINAKETVVNNVTKTSFTDTVLTNIVGYLSTLVLFAFIAIILPSVFKKIENKTEDISVTKFISMIGYGLFLLIIVPVVSILLLVMPITQLVGLLLLAAYIIVICAYNIFAGYLIGLLIWKKFIKKDINILLVGLIGISILTILSFIPYVDVISIFVSILLSLSIFIKLFTKDA